MDSEKKSIKVSLIIPVYNGETFVRSTLDNIMRQTYKNLEIIWVDDVSTDNTVNIIEEYAQRDPRIKVLKCKINRGQGIAKNIALKEVDSDVVCFMDSDDLLKEDIIEKCVELMIENNADIVSFGYSSGDFNSDYKYYIHKKPYLLNGREAASKMMQKKDIDSNTWGKLYKRKLFDGLEYEDGRFENIAVTWRVLLKADIVCNSGLLGYAHLIHAGQVTSSYYSEKDWNYVSRTQTLVNDVTKEYPDLLNSAKKMHLEAVKCIFSKVQCGGKISKSKYQYLSKTYDKHFLYYVKNSVSYRDLIATILMRMRLFGIAVKIMSYINK